MSACRQPGADLLAVGCQLRLRDVKVAFHGRSGNPLTRYHDCVTWKVFLMRSFQFPFLTALLAATIILLSLPAQAQFTRGIGCDEPRRNEDGKLILFDDGEWRAVCDADRSFAMFRSNLVIESARRLETALTILPGPLLWSLEQHLQTNDNLDAWEYTDTNVIQRLAALAARPEGVLFRAPHLRAVTWAPGVLKDATFANIPDAFNPAREAWLPLIRARYRPAVRNENLLVWLDHEWGDHYDKPGDWTPEMIRQVRWANQHYGGPQLGLIVERGGQQVFNYRGVDEVLDPAFGTIDLGIHEAVLAMKFRPPHRIRTGTGSEACPDAAQVGYRSLRWKMLGDVYVRHDDTVADPHLRTPLGGDPTTGVNGLLDAVNSQEGMQLFRDHCRPPQEYRTKRDVACSGAGESGVVVGDFLFREVRADRRGGDPNDGMATTWVAINPGGVIATTEHLPISTSSHCSNPRATDLTPPDGEWHCLVTPTPWCRQRFGNLSCTDQWGSSYPSGKRRFFLRMIQRRLLNTHVEVRTVTDHCFDLVPDSGSQSRTGSACEAVPTTSASSTGTAHFSETVVTRRTRQIPDPDWVEPSPCNTPEDPLDPNHADCGDTAPLVDEEYDDSQSVSQSYTDTDPRAGPCDCPPGWSGSITQERDFSWHDRGWAVPGQNRGLGDWSVGFVGSRYDAGLDLPELLNDSHPAIIPSRTYTITLVADWHEETDTCTPPRPSGGGDSDSPWGYRSTIVGDNNIYSSPSPSGHSRGVSQSPNRHGSAPSGPVLRPT